MDMNTANFESTINDKPVHLFHLQSQDISCYITNYGARVVSLIIPDAEGKPTDIVLGFDSIGRYLQADEKYHGATIGRYANRIAKGSFTLNETNYTLAKNNGNNSLHGGIKAFHNQVWACISQEPDKVILELTSPHLEEGFPGELKVQVTYSIIDSKLQINYKAVSSEDTILNLTHHSYFNLNGEGSGSILNHTLKLNSEFYTPVNQSTIPTGSLEMVSDTPFDFTTKKEIGTDIDNDDQQLEYGGGFDHNFVINQYVKGELNFAATAIGDRSKIKMDVWTTEPGIQFYSANHLSGLDIGKSGSKYEKRSAFCLETQHFPDSPNQSHFPSTLLMANQIYNSKTEYRFSAV